METSSTNEIPGREILRSFGVYTASHYGKIGLIGEIREAAAQKVFNAAKTAGANAVIGLTYDCAMSKASSSDFEGPHVLVTVWGTAVSINGEG